MRGAAHRILHDEALRLEEQFAGRARHSGHPACQKLSPRRAARHFSAGEWRSPTIFWQSPLPRWQAFLQASVVPTLAGGCLGRPTWGPRYVRSVSTCPTLATRCFLRAKWSLLARLRAGVFTCKVFLRCRDARSAWRDDFCQLAWGAVQSSDSTWSGSTFFCTTQLRPCRCSLGGLFASVAASAVHSSMPKC